MLKRRSSVFKSFCLLFAAVLLLSSCGSIAGDGASETDAHSTDKAEFITFTDALGRSVSVRKGVTRAAALIGSFADVWQLAGGTVCATADDAWDDFGLELKDAVNLGKTKSPSLEKLFSSDPELVIASASTAADVDMLDPLVSAGLTVAYFDVSSLEDYLSMLKICTSITDRADLYEKNGTIIADKVADVRDGFTAEAIPVEKRTVLFLRASAGFIRAKGSKSSILGEMLADLGCINVADNDKNLLENLSIESIIKQDPYRIFIVGVGDDEEAIKNNVSLMMDESPGWRELSAVKDGRLYYMDKRLFNLKPNALWGEAYEILCNILKD